MFELYMTLWRIQSAIQEVTNNLITNNTVEPQPVGYLRVVPQLSNGVASMTLLLSICITPQRGSSRRRRLGSTKEDKLCREMCTCIPAGKQIMANPGSKTGI